MKITAMVSVLLTITALTADAQESPGEQIKHGAQKAGETVKDAAKTVGEKTKEAAKTVGEKTKELWRDTKAYASSDRKTYRKGARQKLNDVGEELAELKNRKSEAADPQAFEKTIDEMENGLAQARKQLRG